MNQLTIRTADLVYDCTYALNGPKKHKTYSDGYLYCNQKRIMLTTLEKSTLATMDRGNSNSTPKIEEDDEMSIGKYLVNVGALITNDQGSSTGGSLQQQQQPQQQQQQNFGRNPPPPPPIATTTSSWLNNNHKRTVPSTDNGKPLLLGSSSSSTAPHPPLRYQPLGQQQQQQQLQQQQRQNLISQQIATSTVNSTSSFRPIGNLGPSPRTDGYQTGYQQQEHQTTHFPTAPLPTKSSYQQNQSNQNQYPTNTQLRPPQQQNQGPLHQPQQHHQQQLLSSTPHSTQLTTPSLTQPITQPITQPTQSTQHNNTTKQPYILQQQQPKNLLHSSNQQNSIVNSNNSLEGVFTLHSSPHIFVSSYVNRFLRPHQHEGIKFIFQSLIGKNISGHHGVILMDDVGLGKTLQSIALFDSMLSHPWIKSKKIIICCPNILVNMWFRELNRWLPPFSFLYTAVNANKTNTSHIESFVANTRPHILIISYEQCRKYGDILKHSANCLLVCDEAHRLKSTSDDNKTIAVLKSIPTKLKLLLTATPIQNDLAEFYAMANFANPNFFGTLSDFTSNYIKPILSMQDSRNKNDIIIQNKGQKANDELMIHVNKFCLRRTHDTIGHFLPPKTTFLLFLQPTNIQINVMLKVIEIYRSNPKEYQVLPVLNLLRKISTSPYLLTSSMSSLGNTTHLSSSNSSFQSSLSNNNNHNNKNNDDDDDDGKNSTTTTSQAIISQIQYLIPSCSPIQALQSSSKLSLLYSIVQTYIPYTNIIIISNYTETLRYIQNLFSNLNQTGYNSLNLDGSCDTKSKNSTIEKFNAKVLPPELVQVTNTQKSSKNTQNQRVSSKSGYGYQKLTLAQQAKREKDLESKELLQPTKHSILYLSARAAGAGLNLINGCVQIIVDSNWNPAIDTQASGRMWRVGNHQHVMSYSLITNGSLDEHIFLRQIAKNDIASSLLVKKTNTSNKDQNLNKNININSNSNTSSSVSSSASLSGSNLNKLTPEELKKVLLFQYQAKMTYQMLKIPSNTSPTDKMLNILSNTSPTKATKRSSLDLYHDSDDNNDSDDDNDIECKKVQIIVKKQKGNNGETIQKNTKNNRNSLRTSFISSSDSDSSDSSDSSDLDEDNDDNVSKSRKDLKSLKTGLVAGKNHQRSQKSADMTSSSSDENNDDDDDDDDDDDSPNNDNDSNLDEDDDDYDDINTDDDSDTIEKKIKIKKKLLKIKSQNIKKIKKNKKENRSLLKNGTDTTSTSSSSPNNSSNCLSWEGKDGIESHSGTTIEVLNGDYSFYPNNELGQLTELTLPVILTTQSHIEPPIEGSPLMLKFLQNSNQNIFTKKLISYGIIKQTTFNDDNDDNDDSDNNNDNKEGKLSNFSENSSGSGNNSGIEVKNHKSNDSSYKMTDINQSKANMTDNTMYNNQFNDRMTDINKQMTISPNSNENFNNANSSTSIRMNRSMTKLGGISGAVGEGAAETTGIESHLMTSSSSSSFLPPTIFKTSLLTDFKKTPISRNMFESSSSDGDD